MPTQWIDSSSPSGVSEVVQAIASGKTVTLPTETVSGIFARADLPQALAGFRAITQSEGGTWHAADPESVIRATKTGHPLHLRLIRKLAPGPVTFIIAHEAAGEAIEQFHRAMPAGAIDHQGAILVRIPKSQFAQAVLAGVEAQSPGAVVVGRGWDQARAEERIAVRVAGQSRFGQASTQLRLGPGGAWQVVHEGALPSWVIQDAAVRHILFVCTGNTCRSPMAEAIARHELAQRETAIPTLVHSAGVAAGDGEPTTPEALEALRLLGVAPPGHGSHALTREWIDRADAVYAMTEAHRRQVVSMLPYAADKVRTIDPGGDVPDPIGGPFETYVKTADRLRAAIRTRLKELDE